MKKSLSQINVYKQRSSYHRRFLSKPSLSISRVNSSAYYKRKGNFTKSKGLTWFFEFLIFDYFELCYSEIGEFG